MTALLRESVGEVLRQARTAQGRTLREVSDSARVSLGYLSEVERGRKEASSELLNAICSALQVPLSDVLFDAGSRLARAERAERAERAVRNLGVTRIDAGTKVVIPPPRAMASA
ncbi:MULTISPECIES: transcriptional regulator ClgR [Mycobacteriaceae]|uniref:Transcriptional regulator ClgR n=2 Tax=Mycolicibacter algericus TaxID=1288388 RepID=A0A7I9YA03_MYCAL|nr:transcriptional regulator ClgR [Mycolicibacter algericus]OQZ94563.1 transcriptional regulator [Mycolicibacter algericus DSM 45454]GFG85506.1 transcriptional regulator ClgR [Mycolicibacter algericus]